MKAGKAPQIKQDDSLATYEGRCGTENARIDWGKPGLQIHNLVRGCNPAPGAWTPIDGKTLHVFEAETLPAVDPKGIGGKIGEWKQSMPAASPSSAPTAASNSPA